MIKHIACHSSNEQHSLLSKKRLCIHSTSWRPTVQGVDLRGQGHDELFSRRLESKTAASMTPSLHDSLYKTGGAIDETIASAVLTRKLKFLLYNYY